MSRPVALSVLRARVREMADLGPDTTSGRYPNARINRELNASWQRAREIAVTRGDGLTYLKQTAPTVMGTGPINDVSSFGVVRWPSKAVQIHGIDVVFSGQDIVSLQPMSWGDRNLFINAGEQTGKPVGFCVFNIGEESNCLVAQGEIAIFPASDAAYTYTIWYVPVWVDRTADDHVFDGIAGHEDWAVWDTVIKLAVGDADMQQVIQVALAERAKAETLLVARVNRLQRVGPLQRRDIAGQQRHQRRRWRYR
jgi:hypothetical protein